MYASNFSKYGQIQAIKSTLEFLARDAGFVFAFVNDVERGNVAKVKFGKKQVMLSKFEPKKLNELVDSMKDIHAV